MVTRYPHEEPDNTADSRRDRFCETFIEEGGYGVVLSPLAESQVIDMVQRAWSYWNDSVARS